MLNCLLHWHFFPSPWPTRHWWVRIYCPKTQGKYDICAATVSLLKVSSGIHLLISLNGRWAGYTLTVQAGTDPKPTDLCQNNYTCFPFNMIWTKGLYVNGCHDLPASWCTWRVSPGKVSACCQGGWPSPAHSTPSPGRCCQDYNNLGSSHSHTALYKWWAEHNTLKVQKVTEN